MLSAAKHLSAQPDSPFAVLRACPERNEWGDKETHPVMLSAAKHLSAQRDMYWLPGTSVPKIDNLVYHLTILLYSLSCDT